MSNFFWRAFREAVVENRPEVDVGDLEQGLKTSVMILVRMGNDGALESESLLEAAEAPVQEAIHIVPFPRIDDNELVLGRNEQTAIPLSDINEVHLQQPVFLDVVTMHPARLAASPHLNPLALNRSQGFEPVSPRAGVAPHSF